MIRNIKINLYVFAHVIMHPFELTSNDILTIISLNKEKNLIYTYILKSTRIKKKEKRRKRKEKISIC